MIQFSSIIKKFGSQGEKTGWSYIDIPAAKTQLLLPGMRKSFRVKGFLDDCPIEKIALVPMGGGDFIMALNADIRKKIKKRRGDTLKLSIEVDNGPDHFNQGLMDCLQEDDTARLFFNSLTPGHRRYFSKWIDSAKTEQTQIERIARTMNALANHMDYGQMIRSSKQR